MICDDVIKGETLDEVWARTLARVLCDGAVVKSRAGVTREMLNTSLVVTDPSRRCLLNGRRNLDPHYACGELLWYMSGRNDGRMMVAYAPQYVHFLDGRNVAYGAYGHRWSLPFVMIGAPPGQIGEAVKILKQSPDSRQAVVTSWYPNDVHAARSGMHKDIPCTLSLQFLVRDGRLHMTTTMRSNDVWLGLPYDAFCFMTIQDIVADALGVALGQYRHNVGSMHVYEKHWEAGQEAVMRHLQEPETPMPWNNVLDGSYAEFYVQDAIFSALSVEHEAREDGVHNMIKTEKFWRTTIGQVAAIACLKWLKDDQQVQMRDRLLRGAQTQWVDGFVPRQEKKA